MADSLKVILLLLSGRNNSHDEISMISLEENTLEVWSRIKTFSLSISGAEIETVLVGGGPPPRAEQFFGGGGRWANSTSQTVNGSKIVPLDILDLHSLINIFRP